MLISVIVPIYNVAPYLRECLNSILSQTYLNLEIILINDGSTDESEEIAKEYLQDPRVCLISQKNGGLSQARNVGMKKASGDFIAFIDSDDYLALNFFEEMLKVALKHQVDFVCNENIVYFKESMPPKARKSDPQSIKVCIPDASNIVFGGAVWRFLFSRDFLMRCGVEFLEGKIYEDEAFLYMVAPLALRFVKFLGEPYFYRRREDSIMAKHSSFRSYDLLDVFEAIYLFYQKHELLEKFNLPYSFLYNSAIGYENEREYLKRSKQLVQKLGLDLTPPPYKYPLRMQKFLQKSVEEFQVWVRVAERLSKTIDSIKGFIRKIVQKVIDVAKRSFRFSK